MSLALADFRRLAPGINGPEGVAVDRAGRVHGGGADGVIRRLEPDGSLTELARVSEGQLGGLAFDRADDLYVCDGFNGRVMKVTPAGDASVFAEWVGTTRLFVPNFPAFDADGDLWVTDSWDRPISELDWEAEYARPRRAGCLVRLRPDGSGTVVVRDLYMPNGLAIDPAEEWLYILQTTTHDCLRLRLGGADEPEPFVSALPGGPDGMAFAADGGLVVTFPAERRLATVDPDGTVTVLLEDVAAELLPFPTNCAFGGPELDELHVASMHADHVATIGLDRPGLPLYNRRQDV
jgi:sugar lactone lactonase YvrE